MVQNSLQKRSKMTIPDIDVCETHLAIFEEGTVLWIIGANSATMPRQVGRYLLRRFYEIRTLEISRPFSLQEISLDSKCKRADCGRRIPRERLLNALDRHSPAKYCRVSCLRKSFEAFTSPAPIFDLLITPAMTAAASRSLIATASYENSGCSGSNKFSPVNPDSSQKTV